MPATLPLRPALYPHTLPLAPHQPKIQVCSQNKAIDHFTVKH